MKRAFFLLGLLCLAVIAPLVRAQEAEQSEREAMYYRYLEFSSYVKGGTIQPHWMADGSSFWYAEGAPANTVIYKVDPKANTKEPMFDTERLRRAIAQALEHEPPYRGIPFDTFTFSDDEKSIQFSLETKKFELELDSYQLTQAPAISESEKKRMTPQRVPQPSPYEWPWWEIKESLSPDGRWFASLRDYNLFLRSGLDGRSVKITNDGEPGFGWWDWPWQKGLEWSPDSLKLVAKKLDLRRVSRFPLVHYLNPQEAVEWFPHERSAIGEGEVTELYVVDVLTSERIKVDTGEAAGGRIYIEGWSPDGSVLWLIRTDRWERKVEVLVANPSTGATNVVLTEVREAPLYPVRRFSLLADGKRFIWLTDTDGWLHLYSYDIEGNLLRRLTEGPFPVLRLVEVDEEKGWVYFIAHGDRARPYDTHLYRVSLEGSRLSQLTESLGQHDIRFSPSKKYFLDSHSSLSRPPRVELRQADGRLLRTLVVADIESLKLLHWTPPEEFVVKAADGETDLYGVIYKPYDFDPKKRYPVIEHMHVARTFVGGDEPEAAGVWARAMAQLGFITFGVDVRRPWTGGVRGRGFEQITYGTFGRYEIPDHVAALKNLARTRPYVDLSRVGVRGESFGGYFAIRALLQAPDVYHVGVAVAPITDLYTHANAQWLGSPDENKEAYEYASNLRLAGNLKGKLLLIHGTYDRFVPFSHTMKMVEALTRANKPYDLIVLPEWGHWANDTPQRVHYRLKAYRRYFQEHLKP